MPIHEGTRKGSRGRALALVIAGVLIGALLVPPVGAHVGGWAHNWKEHIRPKTDKRYFTKNEANSTFIRGYEVRNVSTSASTSAIQHVTTSCPAGKVVIGGGSGITGSFQNVVLGTSRPLGSSSWTVTAHETGAGASGPWGISIQFICAFAETES